MSNPVTPSVRELIKKFEQSKKKTNGVSMSAKKQSTRGSNNSGPRRSNGRRNSVYSVPRLTSANNYQQSSFHYPLSSNTETPNSSSHLPPPLPNRNYMLNLPTSFYSVLNNQSNSSTQENPYESISNPPNSLPIKKESNYATVPPSPPPPRKTVNSGTQGNITQHPIYESPNLTNPQPLPEVNEQSQQKMHTVTQNGIDYIIPHNNSNTPPISNTRTPTTRNRTTTRNHTTRNPNTPPNSNTRTPTNSNRTRKTLLGRFRAAFTRKQRRVHPK